jgi:Cdc6-like AAA superfamily ATPase
MKHVKKLTTPFRSKHSNDGPNQDETSASTDPSFPCGLKVWYEPPAGKHSLDLVFVHGLTGDRQRTWTHPHASEPWPKSILPRHFPEARILTHGYDAYVILRTGPVSRNRLSDHSRDFLNALVAHRQESGQEQTPLIFVAHSMGGLVCKDALLTSQRSPSKGLQSISAATIGVCFMGTSHSGSGLARWAKIPATALGVVKSTNKRLLDVLETNNEVIARIQHEFLEMVRHNPRSKQAIELACFYETLPMPHIGQVVVNYESAVLPGFNNVSIRAHHSNMVKFREHDEEDSGRDQFLGILKAWIPTPPDPEASNQVSVGKIESLRDTCLKSLQFDGLNARRNGVGSALYETCRWIYQEVAYKNWAVPSETDVGLHKEVIREGALPEAARLTAKMLWIKGKPGSGKSTIMKMLYEHHKDASSQSEWCTLSFFFNARGNELEKTPSGLYRTLLWELIRNCPTALERIVPILQEKEDSGDISWSDSELVETFHRLISGDGKFSCYIFIDAMDECVDENEVRKIVLDFERSIYKANRSDVNLLVCLSSRHYPSITARGAAELYLEDKNNADIKTYVGRELVLDEEQLSAEIAELLIEKASGVFLWVVLVISRLRAASDQGSSKSEMMSLLRDIPSRLENLFAQIVSKMSQKQRHASLCIVQWISGSPVTLSPEVLYTVLKLGNGPPPATFAEISDPKVYEYDSKRFRRYITDITCGLFEVVEADNRSVMAIVQYIHQSAKDFIEGPAGLDAYGFASKKAFAEAQSRMIFRSYLHCAHTREIRAAFGTSLDSPFAPCSQLIDFCHNGLCRSTEFSSYGTTFLIFMYVLCNSLQRYNRTPRDAMVDSVRRSAMQATTTELRRYFESWLYSCSVMRYIFRDHPLSPYLSSAIQFIREHWQRLGLSESECQQLMRCLANYGMALQHSKVLSGMDWRPSPTVKYHQVFWAITTEQVSVIETVENLIKERMTEGREHKVLEPSIAYEICGRHGTEFLCIASFQALRPLSYQVGWSITEDRQQICELIGVQAEQRNATSHLPLHPKGEISLLLRQTDSSADWSPDLQHTEVVGIFEAMLDKGESLLERKDGRRFRRWTPSEGAVTVRQRLILTDDDCFGR